jgi:hypothetical protein
MLYVKVEELQKAIDLIRKVNRADLDDIIWVTDTGSNGSKAVADNCKGDIPYEDWQFAGLSNKDFALQYLID